MHAKNSDPVNESYILNQEVYSTQHIHISVTLEASSLHQVHRILVVMITRFRIIFSFFSIIKFIEMISYYNLSIIYSFIFSRQQYPSHGHQSLNDFTCIKQEQNVKLRRIQLSSNFSCIILSRARIIISRIILRALN